MAGRATPAIWALLIGLGVIWGSSFMGVAVSLEGYTPLQVAAARITIAALVLVTYAALTGRRSPGHQNGMRIWLHILGFAVFSNVLPFTLLSWGIQHVTSGFAGVSMAAVPLFALPLAHFLVPGERMSPLKVVGFLIGFAGTVVLIGPDALRPSGGALEPWARLACIAATASYACGAIITRLAPPTSMIAYSAATLCVATLIIVPYAIWSDGLPSVTFNRATVALIFLGLVPTALATLIMVHIIRTAGPVFLSLVNYQVPVWAVAFGAVLLSEALPPSLLTALALILFGVGLSQLANRRAR